MSRLKTQCADLFALSFTSVVGKAYGMVSILLRRRQQRHLFHDNTYVVEEMYLPVSLHFSDGRTGNRAISGYFGHTVPGRKASENYYSLS